MGKILVLTGLLFLLLIGPGFADKPEPPAYLALFFTEIVKIEDAVSSGGWVAAEQKSTELGELLTKIASSIRETAGNQNYLALKEEFSQLQDAIRQRDSKAVWRGVLKTEKKFFQTMEFYNYSVHPSFIAIHEYVTEAIVAADSNDIGRVIYEMYEISSILKTSAASMAEKGVGKGMQQDLRDQLDIVMVAAAENNLVRVKAALKKMDLLSGAFIWMGSRQ